MFHRGKRRVLGDGGAGVGGGVGGDAGVDRLDGSSVGVGVDVEMVGVTSMDTDRVQLLLTSHDHVNLNQHLTQFDKGGRARFLRAKQKRFAVQVGAYIMLFSAVFFMGCSSIAVHNLQSKYNTPPLLILCWRYQMMFLAMVVVFFPKARRHLETIRTREVWLKLGLASLWNVGWIGAWIAAMKYTSVVLSYLLSSLHSLLLVIFGRCLHRRATWKQAAGVLVGIVGLCISLADSLLSTGHSNTNRKPTEMLGNIIALMGSFFGMLYFHSVSELRQDVSTLPLSMVIQAFNTITSFVLTVAVDQASLMDLFAWVKPQFIWPVTFLSLVSGCGGVVVLQLCMKYLPSVMVSVALLLEPIFAALVSWKWGIEPEPSVFLWSGSAVLLLGCTLVALGEPKEPAPTPKQQNYHAAPQQEDDDHNHSFEVDSSFDPSSESDPVTDIVVEGVNSRGDGSVGTEESSWAFLNITTAAVPPLPKS